MNENIRRLLSEISELEEELATVMHEQQERLHYRIEGSKIRFEENLRRVHHELKTGVFAWLRKSELRNVVSAPFVYAMIIPFAILDGFLFVFQSVCFPLYRIPKVRRSNFVVLDRHHLGYLNVVERMNCIFVATPMGCWRIRGKSSLAPKCTGARSSTPARFWIRIGDMRDLQISKPVNSTKRT
jgi:hypothetical protein